VSCPALYKDYPNSIPDRSPTPTFSRSPLDKSLLCAYTISQVKLWLASRSASILLAFLFWRHRLYSVCPFSKFFKINTYKDTRKTRL
jgi:hypothetical protein